MQILNPHQVTVKWLWRTCGAESANLLWRLVLLKSRKSLQGKGCLRKYQIYPVFMDTY